MAETSLPSLDLIIIAVYLLLAAQFRSFVHPIIVMMAVPLSLAGVSAALFLTGKPVSMPVMVGLVLLVGIVVNNAIVLVDCINQMKAKGLGTTEAVVHAGRLRLRPVLLTAVTTILGLIPMAIGFSFDIHTFRFAAGGATSAWWRPMAIAVIFGLAVSTLLTLILVPLMYSLADSFANFLKRHITIGED